MRTKRILVFALLMAAVPAMAQQLPKETYPDITGPISGYSFNGHMWLKMRDLEKIFFVWGYLSATPPAVGHTARVLGIDPLNAKGSITKALEELMPLNTPVGDITDFLNTFFQIPENRQLMIGDGIFIFSMKLRGKPDDVINSAINDFRSQATARNQQ